MRARERGRERNRIELQKIYHNSKQEEEASITRDTLRLKQRVEKKNDEILPKHTVPFDDDYNRKKRVLTHEPNTINHTDKRRTSLIRTLVSICLFVQF